MNDSHFVLVGQEPFYKIAASQNIAPFFINVPSASDIWVFLSSNGGVTAGRKNAGGNIFPYDTDDKLMYDYETGSKTFIYIEDKLWQPFERLPRYKVTRNIYKSCYATSIIFEEINEDLGVTYSYKYETSDTFGFVKTSKFVNNRNEKVVVRVLDGLMNILPYGVNEELQATRSTLVDAYKAAELEGDNLGIYSMTSTINDTPHPVEMLKANICYNTLGETVYLNPEVITQFTSRKAITATKEVYGGKCGYFVHYEKEIVDELAYSFVLDNGYDHTKLVDLLEFVAENDFTALYEDIQKGVKDLVEIVNKADGLQKTGDQVATAAHYLNVLYNCMRGGIFEKGYQIDLDDFLSFVKIRNKAAYEKLLTLEALKKSMTVNDLKEQTAEDKVLYRLALEYLPLSFSRRHGDPSRPWNVFNINVKNEEGQRIINYEGNWRDIFQNWEALALSYPMYYENMVAKFVNASTFDGFNPYRINTAGIDWERPEPDNPFSGLGYWGDHQIIYLLRLLEGLRNHYPSKLREMLSKEVFCYANVPYKIKDYTEIVKDSKKTIVFDFDEDKRIEHLVEEMGTDGRLIIKDHQVVTVTLVEKLIVPVLSKISNLLPGGGIWMNTERPEWNDANNAIVGIGLSMVTVYHVSAYLKFLEDTISKGDKDYKISKNVVKWLEGISNYLTQYEDSYRGNEKTLLDYFGQAFTDYRTAYYKEGLGDKVYVPKETFITFIRLAQKIILYTIDRNKGETYSSYNLLNDDFSVTPMQTMLEGQSAVIGSGILSAKEACELVEAMEKELYSQALQCHTLYPIQKTKRFLSKNKLSTQKLQIEGITCVDQKGDSHFVASIRTQEMLLEQCEKLALPPELTKQLVEAYEEVFEHKKFTGRSKIMYKFEGIGCVYWHQNAKFLLALAETARREWEEGREITAIYKMYNDLLQGFIYRKTPEACHGIPIEPYSHTSFNGKSEQPGMTGQVKESILMRRIELGIFVKDGELVLNPEFIREEEFDANGQIECTICSVPVTYKKSGKKQLIINMCDGERVWCSEFIINQTLSSSIFNHEQKVLSIELTF